MIRIRDFTPDDEEAVRRLRFASFTSEAFEPDPDERYIDADRRVVAVDGDTIVGHAGAWRFGQWFGGRSVPMAGVAAVATRPHVRGRGLASTLVRQLLERVDAQGDAIATLHPATTLPYRRLGWEVGGTIANHTVGTRLLRELPPPGPGLTVRPGGRGDTDTLRGVYDQIAPHHPGWLDRPEHWWLRLLDELTDEGPEELWVVEDDDGAPRGYAHVERTSRGDERVLVVHDVAAVDAGSERALWRSLSGSWTIWPRTRWRGPVLPLAVLDLPEQDVETTLGTRRWMTRIVSLPRAIAARGWPSQVRAEVHLRVVDDVLPGNEGAWVLQVRDGRASAEAGGRAAVTLDVATLAALFTGAIPAVQLAAWGRLDGADDRDVAQLGAAFDGPLPTMVDGF